MESSASKVKRKKQADLISHFLDKARVYEMGPGDIVEAVTGLTSWCIIHQAKDGYEDITEALYIKQLKDAFARAKEVKRAKSE